MGISCCALLKLSWITYGNCSFFFYFTHYHPFLLFLLCVCHSDSSTTFIGWKVELTVACNVMNAHVNWDVFLNSTLKTNSCLCLQIWMLHWNTLNPGSTVLCYQTEVNLKSMFRFLMFVKASTCNKGKIFSYINDPMFSTEWLKCS